VEQTVRNMSASSAATNTPPTLRWEGGVDGHLVLLDQTRLPGEVVELHCHTVEDAWQAIKRLAVRGAPAIGVAAAYGVCLSTNCSGPLPSAGRAREGGGTGYTIHPLPNPPLKGEGTGGLLVGDVLAACDYLATSRPTAINLFWALDRMRRVATEHSDATPQLLGERLLAEAREIHGEDEELCASIARHGADLLADLPVGSGILTHCNAGALCATGVGTALGVVFELARRGKRPHVWVDETRPLLQGARLTAWELTQRGVDCTLICDSMAAQVMRSGRVAAVIVGADRVAADGAAANKIGTYSVAVVAAAHGIPLYVAAPASSFDLSLGEGQHIPIEERSVHEVTHFGGLQNAPAGVHVYNPAFDVTPPELIRGIITDRGVIQPVTRDSVAQVLGGSR
jgi:methylthioribose-1-phosphate isomerase